MYAWNGRKQQQLRREQGWSPERLGVAISRSAGLVCRYERGASVPPIPVAAAIAHALGVPIDSLVRQDPAR